MKKGHLTYAGILLFGKFPTKYLPNARVRLLKFEGKNIDDINKRIALLELYEKTSNAYDKGIRIDKEEFKRKEKRIYLRIKIQH